MEYKVTLTVWMILLIIVSALLLLWLLYTKFTIVFGLLSTYCFIMMIIGAHNSYNDKLKIDAMNELTGD